MPNETKYYAVRKGRKRGVFTTWADAKAQVNGFPGAVFKSFPSYDEAESFAFPDIEEPVVPQKGEVVLEAYTDGSFLDDKAGWGFALLKGGKIILSGYGPTRNHYGTRNIAAEIEAAKQAVQKAIELGATRVDLYHDYEGVGRWADGDWRANNVVSIGYVDWMAKAMEKIKVVFHKVKGHTGVAHNEYADILAEKGALSDKATYVFDDSAKNLRSEPVAEMPEQELVAEPDFSEAADFLEEEEYCPPDMTDEDVDAVYEGALEDEHWGSLGEFLAHWRRQAELSISAAAKKTGVPGYERLEKGEDVKMSAKTMHTLYLAVADKISRDTFLHLWMQGGEMKS